MDSGNKFKFEFFKGFTYHFLPLEGNDITMDQAIQLSKCGGGCGGPFWPVRQSSTKDTLLFENEAKRIAHWLGGTFSVVNVLPNNAPWWKKNTLYLKWLGFKTDLLLRKYNIKHRPALVVSVNEKYRTFYTRADLERKIQRFLVQAI